MQYSFIKFISILNFPFLHIYHHDAEFRGQVGKLVVEIDGIDGFILNTYRRFKERNIINTLFIEQVQIPIGIGYQQSVDRFVEADVANLIIAQSVLLGIVYNLLIRFIVTEHGAVGNGINQVVCLGTFCSIRIGKIRFPGSNGLSAYGLYNHH